MFSTAVDILITILGILIALFATIKTVLFLCHKTEHDHFIFFLYFPEFDIMWTSDSRSKQKKKQQNNFSYIILILSVLLILLLKIFY